MKVTAEGIETEEMCRWLADYRCDYLQGYYFDHPMDMAELTEWSNSLEVVAEENENRHHHIA